MNITCLQSLEEKCATGQSFRTDRRTRPTLISTKEEIRTDMQARNAQRWILLADNSHALKRTWGEGIIAKQEFPTGCPGSKISKSGMKYISFIRGVW